MHTRAHARPPVERRVQPCAWRCPPSAPRKSQAGAAFSTIVQQTASGHAIRVARQAQRVHRMSLRTQLRTAQDGWATFSILPRADFPLRTGYNVQFFVRARKNGEDVLGGVSARSLVQVGLTR